jgi:hypothetical protein
VNHDPFNNGWLLTTPSEVLGLPVIQAVRGLAYHVKVHGLKDMLEDTMKKKSHRYSYAWCLTTRSLSMLICHMPADDNFDEEWVFFDSHRRNSSGFPEPDHSRGVSLHFKAAGPMVGFLQARFGDADCRLQQMELPPEQS